MRIVLWFAKLWPVEQQRRQVLAEYAALGRQRLLLADIAKRGGIFNAGQAKPGDLFAAGVLEGRRQIALELIRTAGTDPAVLQTLCFAPVKTPED